MTTTIPSLNDVEAASQKGPSNDTFQAGWIFPYITKSITSFEQVCHTSDFHQTPSSRLFAVF